VAVLGKGKSNIWALGNGTRVGFLAKGVDARFAAAAGAIACDAAAGYGPERGLIASDVASLLPLALGENRDDGTV